LTTLFVLGDAVKRKSKPIILGKLDEQSREELQAMEAELSPVKPANERQDARPSRWARRFAASGKDHAPKLRLQ